VITKSDFKTSKVIAAIWPVVPVIQPTRSLAIVFATWDSLADADLMSMPLPDDAPVELPQVVLTSKDKALRLDLSKGVIVLTWDTTIGTDTPIADLLILVADLFTKLLQASETALGRIGMVLERTAEIDNPGMALAKQLARAELLSGPLNRPEGFEFHAHKVFELRENLPVNSWIRFRTLKQQADHYNQIQVTQDINTTGEGAGLGQFTETAMRAFFSASLAEFDSILDRYFPYQETGTNP
jgi:hypothetical protein